MVSPERLDLMQRQWARLLGAYHVGPAESYPVFDKLVAAYTEPHRHYHTLEHLGEMARVLGRLPVADIRAVQMAVWFHDAVYDPRAGDNEERSAALVQDWLGPVRVPAEAIERVAALVRATAHLLADAAPADADTAALLDADLAILGAGEARYRRYAADIRREYAHVPEEAYRTGRAAVLRRFLGRPRLFQTEPMHAEGDGPARQNLGAELAELTGELC